MSRYSISTRTLFFILFNCLAIAANGEDSERAKIVEKGDIYCEIKKVDGALNKGEMEALVEASPEKITEELKKHENQMAMSDVMKKIHGVDSEAVNKLKLEIKDLKELGQKIEALPAKADSKLVYKYLKMPFFFSDLWMVGTEQETVENGVYTLQFTKELGTAIRYDSRWVVSEFKPGVSRVVYEGWVNLDINAPEFLLKFGKGDLKNHITFLRKKFQSK